MGQNTVDNKPTDGGAKVGPKKKGGLPTGAIIGIVIGCVVVVGVAIFLGVYFGVVRKRNRDSSDKQNDSDKHNDEDV